MINTIATKAVDQNAEILTDLAKKIWEYPETAFNEVKACEWTAEVLKNAGFEELIDHILYNNPNVFSSDKFPQYTYATPDGGLAPVVGVEEKHETTLMQDFIALNKRIFELASTAIKEKIGK